MVILWDHYFHCTSAIEDPFSIDFKLANALWFILKGLLGTIQLNADPLLNLFSNLPGALDQKLLKDIDMPRPTIPNIKNCTQSDHNELQGRTWTTFPHLSEDWVGGSTVDSEG